MKTMRAISLVGVLLVVAAACDGGDTGEGTVVPTTTGDTGSPTTTVAGTATTTTTTVVVTTTEAVVEEAGLYPDLPGVTLLTPASGGGQRPLLEWNPVDGAVRYDVILSKQDGSAYWAWSGSDTSVVVGQIADLDAPGPRIGGEMSWFVVAFSVEGVPIAASGIRPIAP